jgi:hypothetical protein
VSVATDPTRLAPCDAGRHRRLPHDFHLIDGGTRERAAAGAPSSSTSSTPGVQVSPVPVAWQIGELGGMLCAFDPQRGAYCASPSLVTLHGGDALGSLTLAHVPGSEGARELAARAACWRDATNGIRCGETEIAHDIESLKGFPYLLRNDGTIDVAGWNEPPSLAALRARSVHGLPTLLSVDATDHATCGVSSTGEVWCWSEPRYWFSDDVEKPAIRPAARVPGVTGASEIFMQTWLTLCARTTDGGVRCSAPTPARTEVCVLRGATEIACGEETSGPNLPHDLAGAGYDPRRMLERRLVAIPGVSGATAIRGYAHWAYQTFESARRMFVSDIDEGGCALLTDGGVRCWERDGCARGTPWRSAPVEGLPPRLPDFELGAVAGYAVTPEGTLFAWAKRDTVNADCTKPAPLTIHAHRVSLGSGRGRVARVGGGVFQADRRPMVIPVDCAVLDSGDVWCWTGNAPGDGAVLASLSR